MTSATRKTRIGIVVSDKMDKTVVVKVARTYRHPYLQKLIRGTVKCKAHDPGNDCRVGDRIMIEETKPLSKDKRWRMIRILEKAR